MDKEQKIAFVKSMLKSIGAEILEDIEKGKVPETWDGIELRWLIQDRAQSHYGDLRRKKEYTNTVIVNSL